MNDKLTDAQIIEGIEHVFATEHDDAGAIRKVRQLLAPTAPREQGLHPDYDFATASEGERWHYDMGHESGWNERLDPATMDIPNIREAMEILVAALKRLADEQSAARESRGRIEFEGAVIELPDEEN